MGALFAWFMEHLHNLNNYIPSAPVCVFWEIILSPSCESGGAGRIFIKIAIDKSCQAWTFVCCCFSSFQFHWEKLKALLSFGRAEEDLGEVWGSFTTLDCSLAPYHVSLGYLAFLSRCDAGNLAWKLMKILGNGELVQKDCVFPYRSSQGLLATY